MAKERPKVLPGKTIKVATDCGNFYLTIGIHEGELYEVRMEMGKTGHCQKGLLLLLGIHLSKIIQTLDNYKDVIKFIEIHLKKFSCGCPFFTKEGKSYLSCIDWAAQTILDEIEKERKELKKKEKK